MAQYLATEFGQQPETQHVSGLPLSGVNATQSRIEREAQQREAYEEEHFVRLQLTRKQQKALREQRKLKGTLPDELKDLEDWSDLQVLDATTPSTTTPPLSSSSNSKKRTLASILNELEQVCCCSVVFDLAGEINSYSYPIRTKLRAATTTRTRD
jgi:hypothetical protein